MSAAIAALFEQSALLPGGQTRPLALADFHGRWLEWR